MNVNDRAFSRRMRHRRGTSPNESSRAPRGPGRSGIPAEERKFLEPLTSKPREVPFLVYDIESKDGDTQDAGFTRPFLVGMYDGRGSTRVFFNHVGVERHVWNKRHVARGGCVDRFMRAVLVPRYGGHHVYAHNGGSFDHLFLLAWLAAHRDEFDFEVVPVQSSIQILRVWRRAEVDRARRNKKSRQKLVWTFLDSMKLLPMALQKAAKSFGLKGKRDMELNTPETDPRWKLYLMDDCVTLYEVMRKVHELVSRLGGEVGVSAPSTSMRLFLRKYLGKGESPEKVPIYRHWPWCADDECLGCFHAWIRSGYHGGRTEIFNARGGGCEACLAAGLDPYDVPREDCPSCEGTGIDPVKGLRYFDINSSYVASLCEGMPAGDLIVVDPDPETGEPALDWRMRDTHVGFVECDVRVPEMCYLPPLPIKREDGRLIFPTGEFSGVWDADELALLHDPFVGGEVTRVRRVVWIGRKQVFREMMLELWRLRDKNLDDYDEGLSLLAKLLGNGLYGKFAMKEDRTSIVFAQEAMPGCCCLCGDSLQRKERGRGSIENEGDGDAGDDGDEDDEDDLRRRYDAREYPTGDFASLCRGCVGSKPAAMIGDDEEEELGCGVWYKRKRVSPPYIIPQISSHVTALSRVRLWEFSRDAILRGGKIYLQDTDSLVTDVEVPCSNRLGDMKDEYPGEPLSVVAVQPKVYMLQKRKVFEGQHEASCEGECKDPICRGEKDGCARCHGCAAWKVTMKGFPRKVRTKDNLLRLTRGEAVSFRNLQKVRSLCRTGFAEPPQMIDVTKAFRTTYDKRTMLPDGTTRPVVLTAAPKELEAAQ